MALYIMIKKNQVNRLRQINNSRQINSIKQINNKNPIQYNNKILKKIVNVYQYQYKNQCNCGLGDFLRGSFFLLQMSIKNNLKFDIDYSNHPISHFLYKERNIINESINYNNIFYYTPDNLNETTLNFYYNFNRYLNSINKNTLYLLSNNLPIYKINIFQANFIKQKLLPNQELKNNIQNVLNKLNIQAKNYSVIHIRTGDKYIVNNNNLDDKLCQETENILSTIDLNNKVVISDNYNLKIYLKKKYPQLIIDTDEYIAHLSDQNNINITAIKNTLTDFFIMSLSNHIYALSPYGHGTGFSKYCSKIYMIPYQYYNLPIDI
jgi:hypothetical protein